MKLSPNVVKASGAVAVGLQAAARSGAVSPNVAGILEGISSVLVALLSVFGFSHK